MLYTLDDIRAKLQSRYTPEQLEMGSLRLEPSHVTEPDLKSLEHDLGVALPDSFKHLIRRYDLHQLQLGAISFTGSTESYVDTIRQNNLAPRVAWWVPGNKPSHLLYFADTDGSVLLLNTMDGSVSAYLRTEHWTSSKVVARDAELMLRGSGTMFLRRREDRVALAAEIATDVGCDPASRFWLSG